MSFLWSQEGFRRLCGVPIPARVGSHHGGGDRGLGAHCSSIETGGVHRPGLLLTSNIDIRGD
jgi:hypothetical protein